MPVFSAAMAYVKAVFVGLVGAVLACALWIVAAFVVPLMLPMISARLSNGALSFRMPHIAQTECRGAAPLCRPFCRGGAGRLSAGVYAECADVLLQRWRWSERGAIHLAPAPASRDAAAIRARATYR